MTPSFSVRGVAIYEDFLNRSAQEELRDLAREIALRAPLFRPETRFGTKMSVQMTSAGEVGWISDRKGYRYARVHPTGVAWPPIPTALQEIWSELAATSRQADTCLINYYASNAKMGLHQDRDEADLSHPVVSLSLGDDARFRIGNIERGGKTETVTLRSGDALVLAGPARMIHHGVDRIDFGTSDLLSQGGRLNLTLRVARPPETNKHEAV